jgi:hypothetical protein
MLLLIASALAQDPDCTRWGSTDPVFGDDPVPWEFRGNGSKLDDRSATDIRDLGQRAAANGWRVCVEVTGGNDSSGRGAAIRSVLEAAGLSHDATASFGFGGGDPNVRLMIFNPADPRAAPAAPVPVVAAQPRAALPAPKPTCDGLTEVMAQSRDNFRRWALVDGAREEGNQLIFGSLYALPGSQSCKIVQSTYGWEYSCQYPDGFATVRDNLARCFPADAPRVDKVAPPFLSEPETKLFQIGMPGSRHATEPMVTVWDQVGVPTEVRVQAPGGVIPMPWE